MPGKDREKKLETTKVSAAELKMCNEEVAMAMEERKKKFETTKMPAEELRMCAEEPAVAVSRGQNNNVAKVTPAQLKVHMTTENVPRVSAVEKCVMAPEELKVRPPAGAQGMLHQAQGTPALGKASRYPAVLAGVAALTGISTFLYYRTVNVEHLQGKADEVLDSFRPGAAATDAPR